MHGDKAAKRYPGMAMNNCKNKRSFVSFADSFLRMHKWVTKINDFILRRVNI
jgi:hypothetical protein